jgi:AcrR family transcriptional regulator
MDTPRLARARPRDAAGARAALLEAAAASFAEHGFAGARVDAIAAAAGYNKSLLFHYFGDKLQLYAQVLQQADREAAALRARVFAPLLADPALASDARQLRAFFATAFAAIFDHLSARPRLLRILHWEMAAGWQTYAQLPPAGASAMAEQLAALFQQAQHAGLLRSPFAPTIQLTLALQICQTYLASLPLYQPLGPTLDLAAPAAHASARRFVVDLIVGGLLVDISQPADHQEHPTA